MVPGVRYLYFQCGSFQSLHLDDVIHQRRKDKSKAPIEVLAAKSGERLPDPTKRSK